MRDCARSIAAKRRMRALIESFRTYRTSSRRTFSRPTTIRVPVGMTMKAIRWISLCKSITAILCLSH